MALKIATSLTQLYQIAGYWSDSELVRVNGTAVAGDKILCAFTGTKDRGATDNILYPAAGVWIAGPGMSKLIIQGRLFIQGSGLTSQVSRLTGFTLDLKGYDVVPTSLTDKRFGAAQIHDVYSVSDDFKITNSEQSTSVNNITFYSDPALPEIINIMDSCSSTNADRDCISTKGANTSSVLYLKNVTSSNPGDAGNDQAATPHDGHGMVIDGGTYTGNSAHWVALAADTSTTPLYVYNATINGTCSGAWEVKGCVVNAKGVERTVIGGGGLTEVEFVRISNFIGTSHFGVQFLDSDTPLVARYIDVTGTGDDEDAVIFAGSGNYQATVSNIVCSNVRRGLDMRSGDQNSTAQNCLLSCHGLGSSFGVLGSSGQPVTSNVISNIGWTGLTPGPTDSNSATITAQDLDDARNWDDIPRDYEVPDIDNIKNTLLRNGGWIPGFSLEYGGQPLENGNVPFNEVYSYQPNKTFLIVNGEYASTIRWEIKREHESQPSIQFTTTPSGLTNNYDNIIFYSRDSIGIYLNRIYDYYIRIRRDNDDWSDWELLELTKEKRTILGRHRDMTSVIETPRGATASTSNPLWDEQKTSRGAIVTNRIGRSNV